MDQHCSWTIFIHTKFEPPLDSNLAILLKGQIVKEGNKVIMRMQKFVKKYLLIHNLGASLTIPRKVQYGLSICIWISFC